MLLFKQVMEVLEKFNSNGFGSDRLRLVNIGWEESVMAYGNISNNHSRTSKRNGKFESKEN